MTATEAAWISRGPAEMHLVRGRTAKAGVEESTLPEDLPHEHHFFQCSYLVTVAKQIFLFLEPQLGSECHLKPEHFKFDSR